VSDYGLFPLAASSELLPARYQMAFTLGFHIILACMGVAFPAITLVANYRGIRKNDAEALVLAQRWSKVMAVLFAVGAVTGTVLSFEMGLLWPKFMSQYGDAFGIAFGIEGIFFFTEAIFIAIYIYGWKRLKPWPHFFSGIPIVIAGLGGAWAVVCANSWMNQPGGFTQDSQGRITAVDPLEVLFNDAWAYEVPHMILAAYMVAGFTVASVYAVAMLKGRRDRYHRVGFAIPFAIAAIATPVQLFVGDTAARAIAEDQPAKFAAMEYVTETGPNQTEWIYGIFEDGKVKYGIGLPDVDSILVGFSPDTVVTGLDQIPSDEQPPAKTLLHWAFDTMVMVASGLMLLVLVFAWVAWRKKRLPEGKWFYRVAAISGVGAIVALECGWIVTEVGRQPWVVYGRLRTEDAVTGASGVWVSFSVIVVVYLALGTATVLILRRMTRRWREHEEVSVPYGPPPEAELEPEVGSR
jgi:cytochrome bd ubiquinol oxidase subunit I